ncbi:hypothetical protein BJX62DRAFT_244940 [Aspergillus germanicus]
MSTTTDLCIFCRCKRFLVLDYKFNSDVEVNWFRDKFEKVAGGTSTARIRSWSIMGSLIDPKHVYAIVDFAVLPPGKPALEFVLLLAMVGLLLLLPFGMGPMRRLSGLAMKGILERGVVAVVRINEDGLGPIES